MSIAEFSTTLRKRMSASIKTKISRKNSQIKGFIGADSDKVSALRNRLKAAKYNNIVITKQGLEQLATKLVGYNVEYSTYAQYMAYRRVNTGKPTSLSEVTTVKDVNISQSSNPNAKDPWTIIKNTPYDNLFTWTKEYLELIGVPQATIKATLGEFDAGHTLGLNTFRALVSFGSSVDLDNSGKIKIRKEPDLAAFDRLSQFLLDLDLAATNSIKTDTGIYVNAVKNFKEHAQFYIELQVKNNTAGTGNAQTGTLIAPLGAALAKFAKANLTSTTVNLKSEFDNIISNVIKIEDKARAIIEQYPDILKEAALENLDMLINLRGSPSIKEHILDSTMSTLKGEKVKSTTSAFNNIEITKLEDPLKKTRIELQKLIREVRNATKKAKVLAQKKKSTQLRSQQGQFISPVSIKNLLNSNLAQQIQKNMGKGSARNVLNYRTGRFANSARVIDVNTRGNAITAFYSYMKNPYSTFAPGGRQANPLSRDPNKLIQLSIRQLAAGIMANRLKVVPV
jgi:hypothetical protein